MTLALGFIYRIGGMLIVLFSERLSRVSGHSKDVTILFGCCTILAGCVEHLRDDIKQLRKGNV